MRLDWPEWWGDCSLVNFIPLNPPFVHRIVRACAISTLLIIQAPPAAPAASAVWSGASNTLWSAPGNWSASPVPGSGDTATFNNAGGTLDTISLSGVTIQSIVFDSASAAYTLGAGAVNNETLTLNNGGSVTLNAVAVSSQVFNSAVVLGTDGSGQTFTFTNSSGTGMLLTFAGSITGSTGAGTKTLAVSGAGNTMLGGVIANGGGGTVRIVKAGSGTLAVSNTANTFSGGTVIGANAGTAAASTTGGTGVTALGAGAVSIGTGSTLNLQSTNTVATATTINNTITGNGTLKVTFTDTAAATYTVLAGASGFNGTIQLSNTTASNKDKWYANNLGTLNAALVIDSASQIFVAGGPAGFRSIRVSGTGNAEGYGAIRLGQTLNGNIALAGNTTIGLGGGTITGNITSGAAGNQTLTLGTASAAGNGTLSGTIGGGIGTIALVTASGNSTLNAANTFTGTTRIGGGTLRLGHNLALQNSVFDSSGPGALAFAAGINAPVLGGLTGSSNLTMASNVTALSLSTAAGVSTIYAGSLGSATAGMSLTKTGAGTQILSGASTFTGPTLVSQGTLRLAPSSALSLPAGLKIMPLGDSITNGSGSASTSGYRYPLYSLLNPVAPGFQFVGDSTDNSSPMPTAPVDQRSHAGHSSYSCNDISNNLDGLDAATFNLYGGTSRDPHGGYWFTGGNGTGRAPLYPDVILLLAAANDISRILMPGMQGRLEGLLTKITTMRPATRVFLSKATPYNGYASDVATYNGIVDTVAANFQAAGKPITVVDLNTGFPAGETVDAVHPTATGYNWMANRWYDALVSVYGSYSAKDASLVTSALTVAPGAKLEGVGRIAGSLNVAGTVAPDIGTLHAGPTTITGTFECKLNATASAQLAATGNLTLANATLTVTPLAAAGVSSYPVATCTGSLLGTFGSVTGLPAGYAVRYDAAAKTILIATYYEAWRLSQGLDGTNNDMGMDPDGDGASNMAEFALGGNPLDPGDQGIYIGETQDPAAQSGPVLTIATHAGAAFASVAGGAMSASVGSIIYRIEGSHDLSAWADSVTEVKPALSSGLPAAPAGYEYHSFQTGIPPGVSRGFLRLKLSPAP